jgi:hypothetical protein
LRNSFSLALISAVLAAGCHFHVRDVPKGSTDPNQFRSDIVRSIPTGTPVETAAVQMADSGFKCVPKKDARWGNQAHLNFLYCERQDHGLQWQVALVEEDGNVVDVLLAPLP